MFFGYFVTKIGGFLSFYIVHITRQALTIPSHSLDLCLVNTIQLVLLQIQYKLNRQRLTVIQ